MGDNLAQLLFEAYEKERWIQGNDVTPRRFTSLLSDEQENWEKSAVVARKIVTANVLGYIEHLADNLGSDADREIVRRVVGKAR